MKIRNSSKKDIKEISLLFKRVFSEYPFNEKWSDKKSFDKIKKYYDSGKIMVACEKKKIVGFIIYRNVLWYEPNMFIDEMGVDKDYRKRGIATEMLKIVENHARKNSTQSCSLRHR